MRRRFLGAVAALAAAFLAIAALVWHATRDAAPPPPLAAATPPEAAGVAPDRPIDLARAPLGGLPGQQYAIVRDEPPPPPVPGSWEAVPILAPRRGAIRLELDDVQPTLSECFSPAAARRGGAVLVAGDAAPLRDEATTLLLELEVSGDRAVIVEAPVESRGGASDGTLSCAQAVLRARALASPGLAPGRHRLRFTLAP